MVGYLSKESMEAKERVASALRSIGHPLPSMKITVNLSPANIRKNGTAFDFPIAVAFLGCLNLIDASKLEDICIMGELGLNGKIRGVGNCLPIVLEARKKGKVFDLEKSLERWKLDNNLTHVQPQQKSDKKLFMRLWQSVAVILLIVSISLGYLLCKACLLYTSPSPRD